MARHTAGPWHFRPDRTIAAAGVPLMRCYADRNEVGNGPLAAAAPELLESLRAVLEVVGNAGNPFAEVWVARDLLARLEDE